ncbi:MAG: PhzF family phenazine biosynthesis protein [Anaerolineae bacterium]|nr:PhzF family phenazine biosynthesis protein [Phycisphaerae bacterium]
MANHEFFQVDAFADRPFAGNPAAVFILARPADETWMQNVAREMNLSETAFLHRVAGADEALFNLRWFTPAVEVDLCGHATLASAHVLWETNLLPRNVEPRFQSRSGILGAKWSDGWIELDFPATHPTSLSSDEATTLINDLATALGTHVIGARRTRFDLLVVMDSKSAVRKLEPDFGRLRKLKGRGIIVTARADTSQYDFVSRFFAPAAGVDEDPVTGSAHCALTPYWSEKLGKTRMTAYQASPRGGVVRVELRGNRVALGGQAITVARGELIGD